MLKCNAKKINKKVGLCQIVINKQSKMLYNKALHCYILMTIWILVLILGVYKFFEPRYKPPEPAINSNNVLMFHSLAAQDVKTRRILKICNFPSEISDGDEGIIDEDKWTLKGVIVLIRHGDRGPLQHVRNISSVNCQGTGDGGGGSFEDDDWKLTAYKAYLHNLTISGRVQWTGPGPFHAFPLLPTHPQQCQIGQLTMQGIAQLLRLGQILQQTYSLIWPKLKTIQPDQVLVYSTKYRRTFQSALAFLYGLIPNSDTLTRMQIYESQSMYFCFKDCGCPVTEKLWKLVRLAISNQLKSHPAVSVLCEQTGKSLFSPGAEQGTLVGDPHAVRDALLTYICHGSGLPCESPQNCIKRQNVAGVFAYTDWVNYQKWRNIYWKRLCLLRSYGLIRHIVQQMLKMVSNVREGPFLVFYSGHDHTVEQLTTALGLQNDPLLLRYGARVIFEVYQKKMSASGGGGRRDDDDVFIDNEFDNIGYNSNSNNAAKGIYFRLLANGKDVTKQISFCKDLIYLSSNNLGDGMRNGGGLCKIEDIVRFIHDDYFVSLNFTNFKDACSVKTED